MAVNVTFRAARPDDVAGIAAWTQDTFSWGDYVADLLPAWIDDPSGTVLVAEEEGEPIAVGRVAMVSANEAWAQGARVHPDHRRRGISTALSEHLWAWASDRGAQVVRLAVEDDNVAAHHHVISMGFRRTSDWIFSRRVLGERSPVPEGNGGRRVPAPERLQPAHSAEAEPAFLSWTAGELAAVARGLFPIRWVWRTMAIDHLALAARNHNLWEGRPGWAVIEDDDDTTRVHWLETVEDDALAMVRALVDHAVEAGSEKLHVLAPAVAWFAEAVAAANFESNGLGVYAKPL